MVVYMISFAFNWVDVVVVFYLFVGVLILSYYKEVMRCRCVVNTNHFIVSFMNETPQC